MIAPFFNNFVKALEEIKRISKGRENPAKLEHNPLSDKEKDSAHNQIAQINNDSLSNFWESWLEI